MSLSSLSFFTKIQILAIIILSCSKPNHSCLLGNFNFGGETSCPQSILQNGNQNHSSLSFGPSSILDVKKVGPVVGTLAFSVVNPNSKPAVVQTLDKIIDGVAFKSDKLERIEAIIKMEGYPFERHEVTTLDGHILNVFRIPHGKRNRERTKRYPIYIGHGMDSSAADWICQGENYSLPYILAEAGYDVWLTNSRGNFFAREHTQVTDRDTKFWDYSVHEMGKYDVPATINYILKKSNATKLNYIGYSMSTTSYFICMSENPKYNDKINKAFLIAPAVYLTNVNNIGKLISNVPGVDRMLTKDVLTGGQLYTDTLIKIANTVGHVCSLDKEYTPLVCTFVLDLMAGGTTAYTSPKTIEKAAEFFPTSSSGKTLAHYLQFFRRQFFGEFDTRWYSPVLRRYVGPNPPPKEYKLSATTGFIRVFYGETDKLTTEKDINALMEDLKKNAHVERHRVPGFNHLNFIYAENATELVYEPILNYFFAYDGDL